MRRLLVTGFIFVMLLPHFAQAQPQREVLSFQSPSRNGPVTVTAELFLPPGAVDAKLPAMLLHHGSGGVTDTREYAYAREFTAMGVASIIPDSFTPRGVKSTIADQGTVSTNDMLADAFGALKAAAAHPRIDPTRIGIAGFSKGGAVALRAALQAIADRYAPNGPRFALHVPFYPACETHYRDTRTTGAPILMLLGAADTYVGTESCRIVADSLKAGGARLDMVIYPNAQHGWDGVGAAWSQPNGENWSKCFFVQQADLGWVEQTSGIRTAGPDGRPNADAPKALAVCRTRGVSGGPDATTKAASLNALKQAMRETFRLN